jgi:hypothetical protein
MEMRFRVWLRVFFSALFVGLAGTALCQNKAAKTRTVEGCLSESAGRFVLDNGFGQEKRLLEGNIAGLASHVGDELRVTGEVHAATKGSAVGEALAVSSYSTVLKKQPGGVQPRMGNSRNWSTFRSAKFGVSMKYPSKWTMQAGDSQVTVSSNVVNDKGIEFLHTGDVPEDAYPGSNFVGGRFALVVDAAIENAGSCRQFAMTESPATSLRTTNGVAYTEAETSDVGMGTEHTTYSLHTFQNGYCYEIVLELDEMDGTGMDLACSIQWLTRKNEQRLLKALVSQVSFAAPEMKNAVRREPGLRPTVTSLRASPVNAPVGTQIEVSWSTEGADYVQVRYSCTRRLDVTGAGTMFPGYMKCGPVTDTNYPPSGTGKILLLNSNAGTVPFVLTAEPFQNGVVYSKGAKTITVNVPPDRH